MKTVLMHTTPAHFVQQVGRALYETDDLLRFSTTLTDQIDSVWLRPLETSASMFGFDLQKQLSRRAISEFPATYVEGRPFFEIVRTLLSRIDKDKRPTDVFFHWLRDYFDSWVANSGLEGCEAVYSYEYTCLRTFRAAREKGIARIYDVPAPEHNFVENLIEAEFDKFPEMASPYRRYCRKKQAERTEHRRQEWQLADVVITNSVFTKKSYVAAGFPEEKIRVVPCGAPPIYEGALQEPIRDSISPIAFLWAGTFSVRKGAHYLLEAWQKLNPGRAAKLQVLGAMGLPESLIQSLPDSISCSGTVPRSDLNCIYRRSDMLVFPTLCDGFGMVVTEAFAQGLPVITTDRAGAADLVEHGVNGLIVPAGDSDALKDALDWCITHPDELMHMRHAALRTASKWQWKDYRASLIRNISDGLYQAGYVATKHS